jgi:formylmethanofuran dehydrogenase subunit E
MWSGDAYKDADTNDWRNRRRSRTLPKCFFCEQPIVDEHLYNINSELVCTECLNKEYREETAFYVE